MNDYLYKINATDSPNCEYCGVPETVQHFLIQCSQWVDQRQHLIAAASNNFHLSYILGGWTSQIDQHGNYALGPKKEWKADLPVVKATINFAKATDRITYKPEAVQEEAASAAGN